MVKKILVFRSVLNLLSRVDKLLILLVKVMGVGIGFINNFVVIFLYMNI